MARHAWVIWLEVSWKRDSDSRVLGRPEPACLDCLWGAGAAITWALGHREVLGPVHTWGWRSPDPG